MQMDANKLAAFNCSRAAAAFGLFTNGNGDLTSINSFPNNDSLSPMPMEFTPESAEAKLIDYRGEKIAAFEIDADLMICLPQAYELFLKHLVGGLHTVYTKLKRLEITPRVCNVEQVRALRSLGAIQPGVNRCKLISCTDFDTLFKDCTSASSRPGRPPKRSPIPFSTGVVGSVLHQNGAKKLRLGDFGQSGNDATRLQNSIATGGSGVGSNLNLNNHNNNNNNNSLSSLFSNPLSPNSLFPFYSMTPQQFMMAQMSQLVSTTINGGQTGVKSGLNPSSVASSTTETEGSPGCSVGDKKESKKSCSVDGDNGGLKPLTDGDLYQKPGEELKALNLSKGANTNGSAQVKTEVHQNGVVNSHHNNFHSDEEFDDLNDEDPYDDDDENQLVLDDHTKHNSTGHPSTSNNNNNQLGGVNPPVATGFSSIESLLINVVGLIEVAAHTARFQDQQMKRESAALLALYEQEKTQRLLAEELLHQEKLQKESYVKKWKKMKKIKLTLQQKLHTPKEPNCSDVKADRLSPAVHIVQPVPAE